MESVGTPDLHSGEYNPDDLGIPSSSGHTSGRGAVATAAIGSRGSSLLPRVRISAISDLKEFTGKDMDEDRSRAWIGMVKSAFQRDQATEEEKCLTFADLMVGPAKNWNRQLSRTTKTKWANLLERFHIVVWYYHARKRSEETPLDYLHRLNVAAYELNSKSRTGTQKCVGNMRIITSRRCPKLADRLTLLRLADVDVLEEVLRARERAKSRQRRSAFGSKYRQKAPASAPAAPARVMVRAIQAQDPSSESERVSGSDGSDSEGDLRRIFLAVAEEKLIGTGAPRKTQIQHGPERKPRKRIPERRPPGDRDHQDRDRCSHCESRKHTDLDCWKRLTCEKSPNGSLSVRVSGMRGRSRDRGMSHGGILQPDTQMVRSDSRRRAVPRTTREDVKLGRSPGWNPVRAERSRYYIYAYVNKATTDRDLKRGESRGYWKCHAPGKWFRQVKISGRTIQERAILLLDTDAEVSILDTTFARKVGCHFDSSQRQECVGIGDNVYTTEERTRINITLVGYLVYFFDIWIGDISGQNAILGTDFMVPAGVRMDLADGSMRLPDEVGIPLNGRKRLYSEKVRSVILERNLRISVGRSEETVARIILSPTEKLWVARGERWIPTVTEGPGRIRYRVISNTGEEILRLDHRLNVGMILDQDKYPDPQGSCPSGLAATENGRIWHWNRRWILDQSLQNLRMTLQSRKYNDQRIPHHDRYFAGQKPLTSTEIEQTRSRAGIANAAQIEATFLNPERSHLSTPPTNPDADRYRSGDAGGGGTIEGMPDQATDRTGTKDIEPKTGNPNCQTRIKLESGEYFGVNSRIHPTEGVGLRDPSAEGAAATPPLQDAEYDGEIYYHESGDLPAEDLEGNLALLPETPISTTAKVSIEDLQVGGSGSATPEEIEKLR
ncbi:Eukaryotic/viral aspartic protease [Phytophthora megakarya]|uniref:Eukaryotic/viral aspartic protease n=1 Tax=Phytophthora megakarya TaxID=4795 RepID=A0A225WJ73_9STRA|nr:Eukaryotic/viral aspartic protease [Phytophthora megakarya]